MADLGPYLRPIKLQLAEPLVKLEKLRFPEGRIHYFLYQQDGSTQQMSCRLAEQDGLQDFELAQAGRGVPPEGRGDG